MSYLDRLIDFEVKPVALKGGQTAWVREFDANARFKIYSVMKELKTRFPNPTESDMAQIGHELYPVVLCLSLCDEAGKLVAEDNPAAVLRLSLDTLDALYDVAARLNGLNADAVEDAKKN